MNPKMFNSFIDGTKSAIEMTAVCNATGLLPQDEVLLLMQREELAGRGARLCVPFKNIRRHVLKSNI